MLVLSEEEIEIIATRAADKAIMKVYEEIGRSVAQKVFWFVGLAVVGAIAMISGHEAIFKAIR